MDANIAGQSMTADRMAQVDMAGPYYYATIVCLTTKDSAYASATSIADLAGGTCTSQSGTIWYDSCLPQIENANILAPADSAPAMIMQLETGMVDYVCTCLLYTSRLYPILGRPPSLMSARSFRTWTSPIFNPAAMAVAEILTEASAGSDFR